jgi:serine/threonine-protein kinase
MGEVYDATNVHTGEPAAVKLLHRHLLGDEAHHARFHREARAIAQVASDNVVRLLEVSDDTAPVPYIAMERLVGEDLAEALRDVPRFDVEKTVDLVEQVARGIGAAHDAGIVHRDLKPQNIFHAAVEGKRAVWKVLDFGLSKLVDQSQTLTKGLVIGTPAYMAPEQAAGRETDARTDVYALAAIAYRALTGEPPFAGADAVAIVLDVATKMPARPRALSKEISEDVERVLLVGLAKDPRDRFASVEELASALADAAAGHPDEKTRARASALLRKQPWG